MKFFASIPATLILLFQVVALSAVVLCFVVPNANATTPDKLIKIGVLANQGSDQALEKWRSTGQYLNNAIANHHFEIIPLPFNDIPIVINNQMVDFIITNPANYIDLLMRYEARSILTLNNNLPAGKSLSHFGSVIFVNNNNQDIFQINDLLNKRLAAVHPASLGGWILGLKELNDSGFNEKSLSSLSFLETHDAVVRAVLNNEADVGIVRTDILERMAKKNKIKLNAVRVLNIRKYPNFPLLISTELYPEWPIAKLKHTSEDLAKQVAIALLTMRADHQAAIDAGINGWTIPENYQIVHNTLQQLEITPYENFSNISLKRIINHNWYLLLVLLLLLIIVISLLLNVKDLKKSSLQDKQKILSLEEQLRAIFEQTVFGIAYANSNGHVITTNQHLSTLTGYSNTELNNLNFNDLLHPKELPDELRLFAQLKQGELQNYSRQRRIVGKNGELARLQLSLSCVRNNNADIKHIVIIFYDSNQKN